VFVHNQPNGVWRSFAGDRLTGDYVFKDGVVDGDVHAYDEAGKSTVTAQYVDGIEIKEPADAP
jgi:antitoxin component YwqK of YwqJK toxin-antitoxin module